MKYLLKPFFDMMVGLSDALIFLGDIIRSIIKRPIRFGEVLKQIYEQGVQSIVIVILTSIAAGLIFGLQGYISMYRFGAKEYVPHFVALALVRGFSPIFTALIFSGKAGARIAAELGTMNVNDQVLATRTMGVDPIGFLVVPRFLACLIVLPILTIISEIVGIGGGYFVGLTEANLTGIFYMNQTFKALHYMDFFTGFSKVFFFSVIISWVCCYQGFHTRGGSMGVGRFTTKAVALSYIMIIVADAILTKVIFTLFE